MPHVIRGYDFNTIMPHLGLVECDIRADIATTITRLLDDIRSELSAESPGNINFWGYEILTKCASLSFESIDVTMHMVFRRLFPKYLGALISSHRECAIPVVFKTCIHCNVLQEHVRFRILEDETVCDDCFEDYEYNDDTDQYEHVDQFEDSTGQEVPPLEGLKPFNFNVLSLVDFKPSYKPQTLFLGVELELFAKSKTPYDICRLLEAGSLRDFAICKSDSTTGMRGFEIVSCPATFKVHKQAWDLFFKDDIEKFSSKRDGLGLHVHLSKEFFSPIQIGKLLRFYNNPSNESLITAVCGRGTTQFALRDESRKITDAIKKHEHRFDRFTFVNTNNPNTLELRCFQASTNKHLFMSRLEFAQASAEFIQHTSIKSLQEGDFLHWINNSDTRRKKFSNLIDWLQLNTLIPGTPTVANTHFSDAYGA